MANKTDLPCATSITVRNSKRGTEETHPLQIWREQVTGPRRKHYCRICHHSSKKPYLKYVLQWDSEVFILRACLEHQDELEARMARFFDILGVHYVEDEDPWVTINCLLRICRL